MAKLLAIHTDRTAGRGRRRQLDPVFPFAGHHERYALTGRLDYALSSKHQLTVRYNYGHSADSNPGHNEVLSGSGTTTTIANRP